MPAPVPAPSSLAASVHAAVTATALNPAATVVMRQVTAADVAKASESGSERRPDDVPPSPGAPADESA